MKSAAETLIALQQVWYGWLGITRESEEIDADLIVVGSHGHSAIYDVLVGSYSAGILRKSDVPVLVVPTRGKE